MLDFIEMCGALKPKVDMRDYKVTTSANEFPETFICDNLPPVKNQGNVNSCVAHATAAILETFNKTETDNFIELSTNFIYGMQGIAFGRLDQGMYLRDACKVVKEYGETTKNKIPGNIEQPDCTKQLKEKLNQAIYDEAKIYKVKSYARCKTTNDLKYALMNYGPVLASIKWYSEYKINDNIIAFDTNAPFGYHAIMIYGWNKEGWLCQNSWGCKWNGNGRFIYPFKEKLSEAWSFVDEVNKNIKIPNSNKNKLINYIYKAINLIINLFGHFKKK